MVRAIPLIGVLVGSSLLISAACAVEPEQADVSTARSTRIYVRTVPSGADIKLDGKLQGPSPGLFVVPAGIRRMTVEVELDGYGAQQRIVEVIGGRITRIEFELDRPGASPSPEQGSGGSTSAVKAVAAAVKTISACSEGDPKVAEAIRSLKGFDPADVVGQLAGFLDSGVANMRRAAIYILWKGGFPSIDAAAAKLTDFCAHQEVPTRGMAALALGENHVESSFDALVTMASEDKSGYARRCAAYALGLLGDKRAVPILQKVLRDDSEPLVKANATAALTLLGKDTTTTSPKKADQSATDSPAADWSPAQAIGPPNTPRAGDFRTAWASRTPDESVEWLLLKYAAPIRVTAIEVHETFNPGALTQVRLFRPAGEEVVVWEGTDPTSPDRARGVSKIPVKVDFASDRVKLIFDSPSVRGWNEVDAVGLVDQQGAVHWAVSAEASSSYAERSQRVARSGKTDGATRDVTSGTPGRLPRHDALFSYVTDTSADKRSLGGTGEAVLFERLEGADRVVAIQVYASRYGYPKAPDEDFHVYLLDEQKKIIRDVAVPYARVGRGPMRWYTFQVDSVAVPRRFYVALSFSAHRTKGVYVGVDRSVGESHSFVGLPETGFKPVQDVYNWMIRVALVRQGTEGSNVGEKNRQSDKAQEKEE